MKNFALSLSAILLSFVCHAQNTAYIKVANHGSFEKIERVNSGGYISTGYDSTYKLQVIRWDDNFNPLWKYKFTDSRFSGFFPRVVEANDGNFYFMAVSTEYTACTYIAKFSSSGSILWQKIYYLASGNMNSLTLSKAVAGDNGFLFGGGQCTLSNYIIKCDQNGNIEWQEQYFYPLATGVITCWSIIPDGSNYIVSSGYNVNSLLTIKLDASGNVVSHSAYTYTGMQILPTRIVKLNQSGGYAIMGNYNNSNNNKTEFVAIYNNSLSLLSYNELTVTYEQFILYDITSINNGRNIVVNGSIYDNSAFTLAMVYLSAGGNVIWKKRASGNSGGITNVEFKGITQKNYTSVNIGHGYNDGCVIGIIDTNGNGLCNDVAFNLTNVHPTLSQQSSTITVVAANALSAAVSYTNNSAISFTKYIYCGSLSVEENNSSSDRISVFPNPANDHLQVSGCENYPVSVSIFNLTGQIIYSTLLDNSGTSIPVAFLKPGYYMLQIKENGSAGSTLPFIKE